MPQSLFSPFYNISQSHLQNIHIVSIHIYKTVFSTLASSAPLAKWKSGLFPFIVALRVN